MQYMKSFVLVLFAMLTMQATWAQTAVVKGFVYDSKTSEPVIFTNVALEGTTYGVSTDVEGYYSLSNIPAGDYYIVVSSIGYETFREAITLAAGKVISKKIFLKPSNVRLETVDVSAERQEAQTEVKMSVAKITPKEISKIPSVGGEPDLAQALQVQPGVVFTGDQGGQLYIRGGSPVQNKVLLDGMIVYNPFHSIGLFSVFETDVIRNADVYTGGFSADYGGRISSIIDITTKNGSKERINGKVGASTFGAKAYLEGPIKKPKEQGDGSISFVASYKNSYLDRTSESIYSYVDQELPYSFHDLYGKISMAGASGSRANFFGFRYQDDADFTTISRIGWVQYGYGANFLIIPRYARTLIEIVVANSSYEINATDPEDAIREDRNRTSKIDGFNAGMNFTNIVGDDQIKYGFEIIGFGTDFSFENSAGLLIEQKNNTTELGTYLTYRINTKNGKFVIEPSFRFQYYASLSEPSLEPRIGMKYNVSDKFRLKGAAGKYSQNLISANSDRDVVNIFSGFLAGPDNLQKEFTDEDGNTTDVDSKLQKATHFLLGFEYDFTSRLTLNVEGYYKRFDQLTNINRNKLFDDIPENAEEEDIIKKDFIVETGDAYGVDFLVKYRKDQFSIWAVYSLGFVTRWDGIQTYYTVFDRRHNINLVTSYTFGEDLNWEFGARWNLGSGFPFTPTVGFFGDVKFDEGRSDYTSQNPNLGLAYGDINSERLPWYSRFDVSLKRKFVISEHSLLEVNAGCTNLFNRENIFYVDRVTQDRVNQLPILPSLGATLSF